MFIIWANKSVVGSSLVLTVLQLIGCVVGLEGYIVDVKRLPVASDY